MPITGLLFMLMPSLCCNCEKRIRKCEKNIPRALPQRWRAAAVIVRVISRLRISCSERRLTAFALSTQALGLTVC
jgi:hypothetical protein